MAYIKSAHPDLPRGDGPTANNGYRHPLERTVGNGIRATGIPMAFQVTSPFNYQTVLLPHALVLHVNPRNFAESFTKKVERFATRGGFVEQHWGDDLSEISCDQSTGAFVNLTTGLSSIIREKTIAWDKYRDLHDLYRHNASVYDPAGNIVLQGHVMLMYDRGTYLGSFRSFSIEETSDSPFAFNLSWSFKVEYTVMQVPTVGNNIPSAPQFQNQNRSIPASDQTATQDAVQTAMNQQNAASAQRAALNSLIAEDVRDRQTK